MDILTQLEGEHKDFRRLLTLLETQVRGSFGEHDKIHLQAPVRKKILSLLFDLLPRMCRHEAVERRVLFGQILKKLPESAAELDMAETEHNVLERKLSMLLKKLPDADKSVLKNLLRDVLRLTRMMRRHMAREEQLFVLLRKAVPLKELERLGRDAEWVRAVA